MNTVEEGERDVKDGTQAGGMSFFQHLALEETGATYTQNTKTELSLCSRHGSEKTLP